MSADPVELHPFREETPEPGYLAELLASPALDSEPEDAEDHDPAPLPAPRRVWAPWRTWDPRAGAPGPLHGPRRDRADGSKDIPWEPGAKPTTLVYFATPDHRPPEPGTPLVVCEGEKAADAVAAAGYAAAGTVCGAPSDPDEAVVALLARYAVTLAPDHDDPGRRHMARLADHLELAGAASCRIIDPPADAPKGWDLADADVDAATCRELVDGARELLGWGIRPETPAERTTGVRPMTEVDAAPPPPPLVGEYLALHQGEACVLYGPGGSTKGTTAAYLALRHVREDPEAVVYVADFEHHEAEWGGRLRRLGASDAELARIHYASPYAAEWTAPRGLLADVAEYIREDCERLAVSLLIVDSITTASAAGEAMGGQQAATEYFDALARIGRRSLNLAHVKGDAQRWPDRPFGSVHIHNLARETWAIAIVRDGADDPATHGLTTAEVELRCKKANGRQKPRPQVLTYTYEPDYGAITVSESERKTNNGDLIAEALRKTPGAWMTGTQIATAVRQDTGERLAEAQVYDAVRRDRRGRFESDESSRPFKFRVKS